MLRKDSFYGNFIVDNLLFYLVYFHKLSFLGLDIGKFWLGKIEYEGFYSKYLWTSIVQSTDESTEKQKVGL